MISISEFIQLQSISINDQSKLMALMQRIYPPAYKYLWKNENCDFYFERFYSKNNLKIELAEKNTGYYFVSFKGSLVGILRIHFNKALKSMPEKSACYINRIYLAEEAQGIGIANELFKWVEQKANEKRIDVIWLEAMDSKVQALQFYKKQGFLKSHETHLNFEPLEDLYRGMVVLYKTLE